MLETSLGFHDQNQVVVFFNFIFCTFYVVCSKNFGKAVLNIYQVCPGI